MYSANHVNEVLTIAGLNESPASQFANNTVSRADGNIIASVAANAEPILPLCIF